MSDVLEVRPGAREVAVARVPAGVRVLVAYHDGTSLELRADAYDSHMALPAPGLGWGAQVSKWPLASGIALYKRRRDRALWQRAARMLDAEPPGPAVLYVELEQQEQEHYGKPAWTAVRIQRKGEE